MAKVTSIWNPNFGFFIFFMYCSPGYTWWRCLSASWRYASRRRDRRVWRQQQTRGRQQEQPETEITRRFAGAWHHPRHYLCSGACTASKGSSSRSSRVLASNTTVPLTRAPSFHPQIPGGQSAVPAREYIIITSRALWLLLAPDFSKPTNTSCLWYSLP